MMRNGQRYETKAIVSIPGWFDQLAVGTQNVTNVSQAYARVPLVFRALRIRCNSLLRIPKHIIYEGEKIDWPFPSDLDQLLWRTQAALLLRGASYWLKEQNSVRVLDVRWLNPFTVTTKWNGAEYRREYEQIVNGRRFPQDGVWTDSEIVYIKEFNANDDVGAGTSAAEVALASARLKSSIQNMAAIFFENGAMPITTVSVMGMVDQKERERVENFFKRAVSGVANAFRVLALNNDIKVESTQNRLKDLATPELSDEARKDIARAFELPVTLLDSDENYATASVHQRQYYEDTVIPAARMMSAEINKQLLNPLGMNLEWAEQEMPIFQEDEANRASSLNQLVAAISSARDADTLRAAMMILGYDVPKEVEALLFKPQPMVAQVAIPVTSAPSNESAKHLERAQFKRYAKKHGGDLTKLARFEFKVIERDEQIKLLDEAVKSARRVETVAREFEGALRAMVDDVYRGKLNESSFAAQMKSLIADYVRDAYIAGFKYGGGNEEDLDDEDESYIETSAKTQYPYIAGFAGDVATAKDNSDGRTAIDARVLMWASSIRSVGDAGQASVDKNQVMEFKVRPNMRGADEECETCAGLMGKRMKWREIMKRNLFVSPGNDAFKCGGWQCVHGWFPVRGA